MGYLPLGSTAPPRSRSNRSKPFLIQSTSSNVTKAETQSCGLNDIEDILEIIIKQNLIPIYLYTPPFHLKHHFLIFNPSFHSALDFFSIFHTQTNKSTNSSKSPLIFILMVIFSTKKYDKIRQGFIFKVHENLLGLKIRNYTFVKVIGEGNYARVYEAFNQLTSQSVAAKVFPKELFKRNSKLMELVKTEIRVLKECNNENVVRYVDNFMSEKSLLIFMELCSGGELQEYLDKKGRLTEDQATAFLKQIINGFKGLHQAKAMHRDFKASNVLLHHNICKIADLGFAKQVDEEQMTRTLLGSGLTMAPQVHQQKSYGRKADIWSVAIVFYQLLYGDYPFKGHTDHQILKNIVTHRPNYQKIGISEKAIDFIERCLVVDPKKRISWKDVYSHPLIVEQESMKYSLGTSSIKLKQNKQFYDRDCFPEQKIQSNKQQQEILQEKLQTANKNVEQLVFESKQRNKIEAAIKEYQGYYFNHRNKIMFIFKYIVSNIVAIQKQIHANHSITLFIICKKAYLDMKQFYLCLACNKNLLVTSTYFLEFTQSKQYKDIAQLVQSDVSLINLQIKQYCLTLPKALNKEIRSQLQLENAHNPNWNSFVMDIVDSYENELIGNLDDMPSSEKKTVIKLIEALHYFRGVEETTKIEQFDKYIEGLCYSQKELELKQRWIQKLTGYQ